MIKKEARNRLYEGMFVFTVALSEEAKQKNLQKVMDGIEKRGGRICKCFDQGRKDLAYKINRRREGWYYLFYFEADPAIISDFWRDCRLNESLLRFMTLRADAVPEKIEFKSIVQE